MANRIASDRDMRQSVVVRDEHVYVFRWWAGDEDVAHAEVNSRSRIRWCGMTRHEAAMVHDDIRMSAMVAPATKGTK